MAKKTVKTAWFCSQCGAESPKWQGRCPACGAWNTMVEERVAAAPTATKASTRRARPAQAVAVNDIEALNEPRILMPSKELNRVLGGRKICLFFY